MPACGYRRATISAMLVATGLTGVASAQSLVPPFDQAYSLTNLGSIGDVPTPYGGLTIKFGDPMTLLIGGAANGASGALYAVPLIRDAQGHITGFAGPGVYFASAEYNDGGVCYGPGNVLFCARWPVNGLGQYRLGSAAPDRVDDLAIRGVEGALASINFPPPGFPGGGLMKLCAWSGGQWSSASISPDGNGTFNIDSLTIIPDSRLPGGPEGFTYPAPGSPGFSNFSMLVSEYSAGQVTVFDLDSNGDPIVSSRRVFITGLIGAEGANIDPVTGDYLFSTFGGGNQVVVVTGFARPCAPDFNADGNLDPDDLSDYIACYFEMPPCPRADYNSDFNTDPDDLSDYIADFFNGCG